MKNILRITLIVFILSSVSCSKEKWASLNTDPSIVGNPDLRYSVARTIESMYNDDYIVWFYNNFDYVFPWSQLTTTGVGNSENFVEMTNYDNQNLYRNLIPNAIDVRLRVDKMPAEEKARMAAMRAITFPAVIQPAITVTDNIGSIVYTEAGIALSTNPPVLTAVFDNQQKLFDTWLSQLDTAIHDLTANVPNRFEIGVEDFVYKGDYKKWAKFCNLLKLRIAARLINADRAKALKIAEEVANSSAGYMDALEDDFIYNRGIKYYGTNNGTQPGSAAKNVVDFLVQNKDPRVRFIFTKNGFNAEVVQQFIDVKKPLPSYILNNINFDANGNFASWKGAGEPWVRYYGVPVSPKKTFETQYDEYFKQSERNKITIGDVNKTYSSTSSYSEFLTRTGLNFTYPTKVNGRVIEQKDNYPGYNLILGSSAETNLYFSEFKLLGANLPKSAQEYLNKGVRMSVERMNSIAQSNKFPYYDTDPVYSGDMASQASIKLKPGEIDNLLAQPSYNLSSNALEKVYIQQFINFANTPYDLWTLVRRAGVFLSNSTILPREKFLGSGGNDLIIPRRFMINAPLESSKNFQNAMKAVQEQGFTTGVNTPTILNQERLWFDKQNPDYGAGPK